LIDATQVTEIEFVRGVLMKMGKVQVHEFDQIREQFKKFDADNSGAISKEEIIQRSTTKLERPTGVSPWPGEESNDLLGSMARRIPEISLT
jgi:Ca2+-binding EF-hand superfamily protein